MCTHSIEYVEVEVEVEVNQDALTNPATKPTPKQDRGGQTVVQVRSERIIMTHTGTLGYSYIKKQFCESHTNELGLSTESHI